VTLIASADDRELVAGTVPEGFVVAFGAERSAPGTVRFGAVRIAAGELLVAPRPSGVWRSSPWPAADDLFDVAPPASDGSTLVVEPRPERREEASRLLRERGIRAVVADRLRRADLERAETVMFWDGSDFPTLLPSAPPAGRLVIVNQLKPLFGWQHGIDCLVGPGSDALAALAEVAVRRPRAFDTLRTMARLAARPYRASEFYARLALDVSLGVGVAEP
jgi:hypothetical protein